MKSFPGAIRRSSARRWGAFCAFQLAVFAATVLGSGVTANAAPRPALFPGRQIGVGGGPGAPVVADFNGDGVADIAVANWDSDDISILLGHGDGTFLGQTRVMAGPNPAFLAAGAFNGSAGGCPRLVTPGEA